MEEPLSKEIADVRDARHVGVNFRMLAPDDPDRHTHVEGVTVVDDLRVDSLLVEVPRGALVTVEQRVRIGRQQCR